MVHVRPREWKSSGAREAPTLVHVRPFDAWEASGTRDASDAVYRKHVVGTIGVMGSSLILGWLGLLPEMILPVMHFLG